MNLHLSTKINKRKKKFFLFFQSFNGRFPSNHGGDYLSHVVKSASDVQLNQSRYSTSSNYNQFIEDAKLRMHELDREAEVRLDSLFFCPSFGFFRE
jgi:hypothetical protein